MKNHGLVFQVYVDIQGYAGYTPRRLPGGHRIATWLRQHDWDIEVLDFATEFTLDELQEFARSRITTHTKFIGFSCFFGTWTTDIDLFAQWLKQTYPDITLICGGTSYPMIHCLAIDYHITGFAEHAILQLLKVITGSESRSSLTLDPKYLGSKKVITSNTHYPAFPMHDLNIYYEDRDYIDENEWLTIESARGCKFKCKFCNFPILGVRGDYTRNAEDFYNNLQQTYDRYGVKNYYIADETFNDSTEKIKKFADAVERFDFVPFFSGYARADLIVGRPDDREHMLRMNFLGHFYGIESTNPKSLKVVGKGMHPDRLLPGLLDIQKYFQTHSRGLYRTTVSLIAGLPNETLMSLYRTMQWMIANWQGHHLLWFPLEIPLQSNGEGLLSDISVNLEKYGYSSTDVESDDHSCLVAEDVMNWQSPYMNRKQAQEFVRLFHIKHHYFVETVAPMALGVLARPGYGPDEILTNTESPEVHALAKAFGQQLVTKYKHCKLGR
jgi:hypothetical protein